MIVQQIPNEFKKMLDDGVESDTIEFKAAQGEDGLGRVPKSIYETICSFSNHFGGNIFLGVDDSGQILGLTVERAKLMRKDLILAAQSENKISPAVYLDVKLFCSEGKAILYVYVPNSSQVHRLNGTHIFDRNDDADVDITKQTSRVQKVYLQKQNEYSENKVYPYADIADLQEKLIIRVANSVTNSKTGEKPLIGLKPVDVLKALGLYKRSLESGTEGITLAAILLFGTDEAIKSVAPYYVIDVLIKIVDEERYDDRLRIQINLIDAYSEIMAFLDRYFSEPFLLDGTTRVNPREIIFRELVVNMLVHREYASPYPSRILVYKNRIDFENANKPFQPGIININDIRPYSKNPNIATVFHHLGLVDEVGSGMKKVEKYAPTYFGGQPVVNDDEIFSVRLPITSDGISRQSHAIKQLKTVENDGSQMDSITIARELVIKSMNGDLSAKEIYALVSGLNITMANFRDHVLNYLLQHNQIERTIPEKPTSPRQKYRKTAQN
ncbi:RNA-binding domain-containing protein [Lacticaseibacillus sharpeae]|nr:RNA-binding domain-containing protein [Lacticaseibacillus sharpeae]